MTLTNTVIVEAVPKAILVTVVNPFADPDHGLRLGVLGLVLHGRVPAAWLGGDQLSQLLVQLTQVAVRWSCLIPGTVLA